MPFTFMLVASASALILFWEGVEVLSKVANSYLAYIGHFIHQEFPSLSHAPFLLPRVSLLSLPIYYSVKSDTNMKALFTMKSKQPDRNQPFLRAFLRNVFLGSRILITIHYFVQKDYLPIFSPFTLYLSHNYTKEHS